MLLCQTLTLESGGAQNMVIYEFHAYCVADPDYGWIVG